MMTAQPQEAPLTDAPEKPLPILIGVPNEFPAKGNRYIQFVAAHLNPNVLPEFREYMGKLNEIAESVRVGRNKTFANGLLVRSEMRLKTLMTTAKAEVVIDDGDEDHPLREDAGKITQHILTFYKAYMGAAKEVASGQSSPSPQQGLS